MRVWGRRGTTQRHSLFLYFLTACLSSTVKRLEYNYNRDLPFHRPLSQNCHHLVSQSFVFLRLMTSRFNTNCHSSTAMTANTESLFMTENKRAKTDSKYWRWMLMEKHSNPGEERQRQRQYFCLILLFLAFPLSLFHWLIFYGTTITYSLSIINWYSTVYTD